MPTSSERWGSGDQYGKYAVKVYTIDGVLIYQEELGRDNTGKSPLGGVIFPGSNALSMLDAIANPITYYGSHAVINQAGHSGDLYNYYWTSYSRGTDGRLLGSINEPLWHNAYLDGYIPLRAKSIYDPCPYLYRIPSNGTYNQFEFNQGWTWGSYLGGVSWSLNSLGESWFTTGRRGWGSSIFEYGGHAMGLFTSTTGSSSNGYGIQINYALNSNLYWNYSRSHCWPVRCIEECFLDKNIK